MANDKHRASVSCGNFVLVVIMLMLIHGCAEDGKHLVGQKYLGLKHKGTIKTIEGEDGEMIDCVDIYKQPAFDHPLIKDLQYATVSETNFICNGASASITLWNPKTEVEEISVSQILVGSDVGGPNTNAIEAGWIVYPGRYNDNRTRFFTYWTRDNYRSTGCYELSCPGFVQTNHKFALGSPIAPISTYGGNVYEISIAIFKDKQTGNWWLQLQGVVLGYWPRSIFTGLAYRATAVSWGGNILNKRSAQHHTTTQMGSGHFSSEGIRKSSYFGNLKVIDNSNTPQNPSHLHQYVTDASCYDLNVREDKNTTYYFYGGPGYSAKCL